MRMGNEQIANALDEIANLLEIDNANPFRVRAYRNAARTVRGLGKNLATLVQQGRDLKSLPGIGRDLAAKIEAMLDTGHMAALDELHKKLPASLEDLLRIPGMGPKRVQTLYHKLGIKSLPQLERAARSGRLRELPGFGSKLQQQILDAIAAHRVAEVRWLRAQAAVYAEQLVAYLKAIPGVNEVVVTGSYRRGNETVGDLDIVVTAAKPDPVMQGLVAYPDVKQVVSSGSTRSSVILGNGLQVDVRAVKQHSLGAALHYFTGSKAHNIQIRRLGQKRGLKINEYGVFKGKRLVAGNTEQQVFRSVGLPWIPPELREGDAEIDAARRGELPKLIERDDLKGDLHAHTQATDGQASIEEMVTAAKRRGLRYIAITDHSRHLTVAHGLDVKRLLRQIEQIDHINEATKGITVLKGTEVDILEDGALDLPDAVLARLDLVIGAVHSHFQLPRNKQTERILRAMDHRYFSILAHPSGRLIGARQAYAVDMERVVGHAAQRGCFLELNGQPQRLDLNDTYCRMAQEQGVLVSVNSDAHSVAGFDNLDYGIVQARRGWLAKDDVLNTRAVNTLRRLLRQTLL